MVAAAAVVVDTFDSNDPTRQEEEFDRSTYCQDCLQVDLETY